MNQLEEMRLGIDRLLKGKTSVQYSTVYRLQISRDCSEAGQLLKATIMTGRLVIG